MTLASNRFGARQGVLCRCKIRQPNTIHFVPGKGINPRKSAELESAGALAASHMPLAGNPTLLPLSPTTHNPAQPTSLD